MDNSVAAVPPPCRKRNPAHCNPISFSLLLRSLYLNLGSKSLGFDLRLRLDSLTFDLVSCLDIWSSKDYISLCSFVFILLLLLLSLILCFNPFSAFSKSLFYICNFNSCFMMCVNTLSKSCLQDQFLSVLKPHTERQSNTNLTHLFTAPVASISKIFPRYNTTQEITSKPQTKQGNLNLLQPVS